MSIIIDLFCIIMLTSILLMFYTKAKEKYDIPSKYNDAALGLSIVIASLIYVSYSFIYLIINT